MNQFYIYPYQYIRENEHEDLVTITATVVFCENDTNITSILQTELQIYYETHEQTDEMFVFGSEDLGASLIKAFDTDIEDTFRFIPPSNYQHLKGHTFVVAFDEMRVFKCIHGGIPVSFTSLEPMFNEGLRNIFIIRGGLIQSNAGHHYVFPSGKHCDKFLRTGNILLHSSEIFFIAFCLLDKFQHERHLRIYCDTSSINTLAFALQELKRRILHKKAKEYKLVPIESFSSYEGLVKGNSRRLEQSLILISASTSGNILQRILKAHPIVNIEDIKILYFLGPEEMFLQHKSQILCNLTKVKDNPKGIALYPTYQMDNCEFCNRGSYPAKINGDVFLPENPKINTVIFTVNDPPPGTNAFLSQFGSIEKTTQHFFKVNYKEGSSQDAQYEIYMDMFHVIMEISKGSSRYSDFKAKLESFINQYVPSNLVYLIHLPDEGSKALAEYILSRVGGNYAQGKKPTLLKFDDTGLIQADVVGSIIIVASCISHGKNLLYLSRALRNFDQLNPIYFVGMTRMTNEESLEFLKSNLKQGKYGKETNSFYAVNQVFCTNEVKQTTWFKELEFLKSFKGFIEDSSLSGGEMSYLESRIELLETSMSQSQKGLANRLFYPSILNNEELELRKNYAFLSYRDYHNHVSQADVYFTISSIFNRLRNGKDDKLKQSEYVRSLVDPNNFNRFSDGIIQASILRAAHVDELCYHIDDACSIEMKGILETIIRHQKSEQGEALLEFLYALAVGKMTLKPDHLLYIARLVLKEVSSELAKHFASFIIEKEFKEPARQRNLADENSHLKEEISQLKELLTNAEGLASDSAIDGDDSAVQ